MPARIRPATADDVEGIRWIQRASGRTDSERFADEAIPDLGRHRTRGFEKAGRAPGIHGVPFTSGTGVLLVRHR